MSIFLVGVAVGILAVGLVMIVRHDAQTFLWSWAAQG